MKGIIFILVLLTGTAFGQFSGNYGWTPEDSLKGEAMIKTIEQSLDMFYAEYSPEGNYDSIIKALNYEAGEVVEFPDSVYCERLNVMNEMSPFHLDCNDATLSTIRFFCKQTQRLC